MSGEGARRLRAAVVGLGIGRHHVQAFATHPRVDLVAVCDADPERCARFQQSHPASRTYPDLEAMLARETLDLVTICTPDWLHAEMGVAALRAGAHVICVKPLSTTIEDARRAAKRLATGGTSTR